MWPKQLSCVDVQYVQYNLVVVTLLLEQGKWENLLNLMKAKILLRR